MSNTLLLSTWIQALPDSFAVYMIECLVTGSRYVGSAHKQVIASRLAQQVSDLEAGQHHSSLLQQDWNRFGSQAFAWLVRPTKSGRDSLLEEFWLIRASKAFADFNGYVLRADVNCVSASVPETERKLAASPGTSKFSYLPGINPGDRIHPVLIRTFCRGNRPLFESKKLTLDVCEEERLRLVQEWASCALRFDPVPT